MIFETPAYNAAFRTTQADKASSLALAAWLEKGISLANKIDTESFSKEKLNENIPRFRRMTNKEPASFLF